MPIEHKRLSSLDMDYGRLEAYDVGLGVEWRDRKTGEVAQAKPWMDIPATLADIRDLQRQIDKLKRRKK